MAETPLRPNLQHTNLPSNTLLGSLQGEVGTEAAPMLQFVLDHVRIIAGAVGLLVLVVVIAGGWRMYTRNTLESAQTELGRIIVTMQGKDRLDALAVFADKSPSSLKDAVRLEEAATAMELGDYQRAATAYAALSGDDGGAGVVAAISQAGALVVSGKAAEALAVLEKAEAAAPEAARNLVRMQLAVAAEAAGQPARALAACEAVLASGNTAESDYLRFKVQDLKARIAAKG